MVATNDVYGYDCEATLLMMVYAGFAGAERKNGEIVSRPCSIVADDERHAQRILVSKAKEIWPEGKGWKGHCAFVRLVPLEQMNLDERVVPKFLAEDMEKLRDFFED